MRQARPQVPEAVGGGTAVGPPGVGQEGRQGRAAVEACDGVRPAGASGPTAFDLAQPSQWEREQRAQQQASHGPVLFGPALGSCHHAVEDEPDGAVVGEPGVGPVVGDTAPLEGARQLGEEAPLAADQHRHPAVRNLLEKVRALEL